MTSLESPAARFVLLIALSFFFGLAFEEFHSRGNGERPGGIRSFPLLALTGALLYGMDTHRLLPMSAGLLVLGAWLSLFYWRRLTAPDHEGARSAGLMAPACNLMAYVLGPVALAQPPWVAVGATVAAVLLLTGREKLHGLAQRIDNGEIVTAGKFLLLTGLILPLLPDVPVTRLTEITPHQVWLGVVAVCTISYVSYLLQRFIAPAGAALWVALLGGLYSSTATTVVLARRARAQPATLAAAQTGIILATAVMYLRLLAMILVFSRPLAAGLAPGLLGLSVLGFVLAGLWHWKSRTTPRPPSDAIEPGNPLELGAAAVFAIAFVLVSLATAWAQANFGVSGLYVLAGVVGVSDIDPFVLSLAEHGTGLVPLASEVVAILIAASSNNLLKAGYTLAFAGVRASRAPVAALVLMSACGVGLAWYAASP